MSAFFVEDTGGRFSAPFGVREGGAGDGCGGVCTGDRSAQLAGELGAPVDNGGWIVCVVFVFVLVVFGRGDADLTPFCLFPDLVEEGVEVGDFADARPVAVVVGDDVIGVDLTVVQEGAQGV